MSHQAPKIYTLLNWTVSTIIRRRSDYIIGFIAPAIGPNKSQKLTRLTAPAHNIRGKVWMKINIHGFTERQTVIGYEASSNFAAYIVCRRYKPCEFPRFVWTDCWGNKSYYVITSPANRKLNALLYIQLLKSYVIVVIPCGHCTIFPSWASE